LGSFIRSDVIRSVFIRSDVICSDVICSVIIRSVGESMYLAVSMSVVYRNKLLPTYKIRSFECLSVSMSKTKSYSYYMNMKIDRDEDINIEKLEQSAPKNQCSKLRINM
jgi:hypothetical protein